MSSHSSTRENPDTYNRKSRRYRVHQVVLTALLAAVIACLSQLSVPFPGGVPLTLQTVAVSFAGYFAGRAKGTAAVAVYLALGCIGAPVFSGFTGGAEKFVSPTGGFLIGFLALSFMCGVGSFCKNAAASVLCGAAGLAVCHVSGIAVLSLVTGRTVQEAFLTGSLPYLLKDLISVAAARFLASFISVIYLRSKSQ
ncbi:MAG: biotin transporter BioY [Clostridia bacterium]|nr:biotin transporter BioY [Clostridia bacterium]